MDNEKIIIDVLCPILEENVTLKLGRRLIRMRLSIFPEGSSLRVLEAANETRNDRKRRIIAYSASGRILRRVTLGDFA